MAKVITFERVNPNAAAIDIGAQKVFMSPDGNNVHCYETFTVDYRRMIGDLHAHGIERICMEATGVYWIALYEMLEASGIEVCLVNPKEVKQVKGRKTDPKDCRWIQKMFSAGLVRQSYVPAGKLKELRMVVREREDIISMGSTYVNKMQKCLELMNIKLTEILAQIHGASGIRMIEAIIAGQRDPQQLLLLCDKRIIKHKSEEVLKALEGNYNESWLFLLEQNLNMWQLHEQRVLIIDKKIEELLSALEFGKPDIEGSIPPKPIRHHAPKVQDLHQKLLNIYGADPVSISGINDYTLLRLLGEVGSNMERFPTVKHFVSWCQLSPMQDQSGKMRRRVKVRNGSKAGQIFRDVAHGLLNSKHIAIGAFMRRLRAKKDSRVAVKAGARKLAEAFYNLLTKGAAYVEQGVKRYEEQIRHRELLHLERLAKKHDMQLINT
jgi:transposase